MSEDTIRAVVETHIAPYFGNGAADVVEIAAKVEAELLAAGWRRVHEFGNCRTGKLYVDQHAYETNRPSIRAKQWCDSAAQPAPEGER